MALVMAARRHYSSDDRTGEPVKEWDAEEEGQEEQENKTDTLSPESEMLKKLQAKEQEVVDLTGRLRYLQADFLNLQRNAAREKEQQRDFAITRFASDLLETADVLELALKSVSPSVLQPLPPSTDSTDPQTPSSESNSASTLSPTPPVSEATTTSTPPKSALAYLTELHEGVDMTHRLLQQTLFKYHVKPFDPTADVFDPNRHEALYQAPVPGKEPGTVIDCQKIGYTIKDRILRAAQVGVAQ